LRKRDKKGKGEEGGERRKRRNLLGPGNQRGGKFLKKGRIIKGAR